MPLHDDPLWPRAGDWPVQDGTLADLILVGVPTSETVALAVAGSPDTGCGARGAAPVLVRDAR